METKDCAPMNVAELEPRAEEAAQLLTAMANPKRLLILCNLLDQERSVSELSRIVDLDQSPLSQHLSKLRALGLVKTRREGQAIFYRLASEPVSRVLATLYDIYCRSAVS
ncbi:transcriptional regulator [Devosia soli]|uniref:Transcriptional regulator n=1 Tax=Devosia soli TaxID=361041 RepID=A0A0F5L2K6_9HYPH|nr:metalloregulator ArsR/SmtB family transcription factor [Devosia soli]KKB75867.1 transcriptional regulator [Devosia soli]